MAATNLWKRPRAKSNRNRRALARNQPRPTVDLVAASITFSTPNITVTLNQRFVLKDLPQWLTNTGKLPTVATKMSPTVVRLTYDTPGSVTSVTVPVEDPGLRSFTGGYATAGTFLAPAP